MRYLSVHSNAAAWLVWLLLGLMLMAAASAQGLPPARVVTAAVTEQALSPSTRMLGVLRFLQVAEVPAEVEGLIVRHDFDTGWVLEKGAVMVELNQDFLRKDMDILRSQMDELDAETEKHARELARLESLKKDNMASRSSYDESYYALAALRKQRNTLTHRLERIQIAVEKSQVRAPFQGLVLEKKKELGDWVDKGDVLARLGAIASMQVIVPVSETLLPFQQPGKIFEVHIPALEKSFQGMLTGLVPFAETRSKSVYLKLALPYEAGMIENLTAEVEVPTAATRRLRLIPRAALLQSAGSNTVYTLVDGKATPLSVNIVARSGPFIAVDDADIKPGMPVVVDGNDRLRPGQPVQVIEP